MSDSSHAVAACADSIDYAALLKRCMGRVELMARILSRFRVVVTQEIAQLGEALEQADQELVLACAHRLKGTCLTASANSLAQLAEQLHRTGVLRQSFDIRNLRSALDAELVALLASITEWELGAQREND